jgi:hypothetical protein
MEIAEQHLVRSDRGQSQQRNGQCVALEYGDTQQGGAEQQEFDRYHPAGLGAWAAMTPLRTASVMAAMSGARYRSMS